MKSSKQQDSTGKSTLAPPDQKTTTRRGDIGGGPTRGGMGGGPSRRTGQMGHTTRRRTAGVTTTGTQGPTDVEYVVHNGQRIYVKPKPLMMKRSHEEAKGGTGPSEGIRDGSQSGASAADQVGKSKDTNDKAQEEAKKTGEEKKSETSQMNSSYMDTSENDSEKKAKEEAAAKAKKRGLSAAELEATVDIELSETRTQTLLHIPGCYVKNESQEHTVTAEKNKGYDELKKSKIGSDLYTMRGSQTLNATRKNKQENFQGFTTKNAESISSNWAIAEAQSEVRVSKAVDAMNRYNKSIDDIMNQALKTPDCLFDAEASLAATHLSITSQSGAPQARDSQSQSMSNSSRGRKAQGGSQNVRGKGSQSGLRQSRNDSEMSSQVSGSMNRTSNQFSTETGMKGDFATIKAKNIIQVDEDLPESMMKAITIIERLLTQSDPVQLKAHVLYKDYPQADIDEAAVEEDEDKDNQKKRGRGGNDDAKKKEEEEKKKEQEAELSHDEEASAWSLKPLFKFHCDLVDGRQVSCMDINEKNPDLIAVSYGEYDINISKDQELKPGILAFWTLKNPTFPERYLEWDYSITSCMFSKKQPHLIAIGDSQGNVAIFNIRADDLKPIASTKDLDNKHRDIVWEVQWVDKGPKPESLISVAGDGRVISWSMKRGLDMYELFTLKRETNPNQKDVFQSANAEEKDKKQGMTFIQTGGMAIDFPKSEQGAVYFAATEDCSIHKCSVSYPDQYMACYYGHQGPVYRVRCNPFWHSTDNPIFLTCSYDWTVRVWNASDQSKELLICHDQINYPLRAQVNDIVWSPITSSAFASVADDGRIEIWDLKITELNPQVTHFDKDPKTGEDDHTPKTVIRYSVAGTKAPIILTGNSQGAVDVYRTYGQKHGLVSFEDQVERLQAALAKEDYAESAAKDE